MKSGLKITLLILIISTMILVSGLGMSMPVRAQSSYTVGLGGFFNNVSDALSSGLLNDGDSLVFISNVTDDPGLAIDVNITIDGNGYSWIFSPPPYRQAIYLCDRPNHVTSVTVNNVTLVAAGTFGIFIYSNASQMLFSNVTIAYSASGSIQIPIYGDYSDQSVSIYLLNLEVWPSSSLSTFQFLGSSEADIYIIDASFTGSGVSIEALDNSRVKVVCDNISVKDISYPVFYGSYFNSTMEIYMFDLKYSNVLGNCIYVDFYGYDGSIYVDNATVYNGDQPFMFYDYSVRGADIALSNIYVDSSQVDTFYIERGVENGSTQLRNIFIGDSGQYGIYILDGMSGSPTNGDVIISNITLGYTTYPGVYINKYGSGDVIVSGIHQDYSDDFGLEVNSYVDDGVLVIKDVWYNATYYRTISAAYSSTGVGAVYIDNVSIWDGGLEGDDAIRVSARGAYVDVFLTNIFVNASYSDSIYIYRATSDGDLYLMNVTVNRSWTYPIYIYDTPLQGDIYMSNIWINSTVVETRSKFYLYHTRGATEVYINNMTVIDPNSYSIQVYTPIDAISTFAVFNSRLHKVYLPNLNAYFSQTYFDEAHSYIPLDTLVEWTLRVRVLSETTLMPVSHAVVRARVNSTLLDMGVTNPSGYADLDLSYIVNADTRAVDNLVIVVEYGDNVYSFTYGRNYTMPSWSGVFEVYIKATYIKLSGVCTKGLAVLSLGDVSGTLKIACFFNPSNPGENKYICYDVRVLSIRTIGNTSIIEIEINMGTGVVDNWLPAKIIIDRISGKAYLFGPVTMVVDI